MSRITLNNSHFYMKKPFNLISQFIWHIVRCIRPWPDFSHSVFIQHECAYVHSFQPAQTLATFNLETVKVSTCWLVAETNLLANIFAFFFNLFFFCWTSAANSETWRCPLSTFLVWSFIWIAKPKKFHISHKTRMWNFGKANLENILWHLSGWITPVKIFQWQNLNCHLKCRYFVPKLKLSV